MIPSGVTMAQFHAALAEGIGAVPSEAHHACSNSDSAPRQQQSVNCFRPDDHQGARANVLSEQCESCPSVVSIAVVVTTVCTACVPGSLVTALRAMERRTLITSAPEAVSDGPAASVTCWTLCVKM